MPANKSHHYVPKMYMRLFSHDALRVGVFVIASRKFIPHAPISGQACRDYFYGRDPAAEHAFGRLEGRAAAIIADIMDGRGLPAAGSEAHEMLVLFVGMQRARTVAAAEEHNEAAVKAVRAVLRRKAMLEGDEGSLKGLDLVRIRRTNAVSETVAYATVGSSLLMDLRYVLLENRSEVPFVASDAPVVLHNRMFEGQRIGVVGYASVGLQLILPLGPRLALMGYDPAAYRIEGDGDTVVVTSADDARLLNDLQWESAHAVILAAPDAPEAELKARADHWAARRSGERFVFKEEVVEDTGEQIRTRQGGGAAPSSIALNLSFMDTVLPPPPRLGEWELPQVRDPDRVDRTDRAFESLAESRGGRRRR